ncbi:hypothetical protein FGG08_004589 [Glutinoglossum americanum]|uniref:PD-(D/E)XK nuclease-like domain-containing protein n=1 Tax=Glutinoglossum americanum TaxID=1670608 RepID=A0A9P8KZC9_9PEZI|nr:hypothetical protein FGG08_004589 [Glutinoglossum americanum]
MGPGVDVDVGELGNLYFCSDGQSSVKSWILGLPSQFSDDMSGHNQRQSKRSRSPAVVPTRLSKRRRLGVSKKTTTQSEKTSNLSSSLNHPPKPTINMQYLRPPIFKLELGGGLTVPPSVRHFLDNVWGWRQSQHAVIPRGLKVKCETRLLEEGRTGLPPSAYDSTTSIPNHKLRNLWENVTKIRERAKECEETGSCEGIWISEVVRPLLDFVIGYGDLEKQVRPVDVRTANISPTHLLPTSATGQPTTRKRVDYILALLPPHSILSAIEKAFQVLPDDARSINQSLSNSTSKMPIIANFGVKKSCESEAPIVQLGIWSAAGLAKMKEMNIDKNGPGLVPGITVVGHDWRLYFAYWEEDSERVIISTLEVLAKWGVKKYGEWVENVVLKRLQEIAQEQKENDCQGPPMTADLHLLICIVDTPSLAKFFGSETSKPITAFRNSARNANKHLYRLKNPPVRWPTTYRIAMSADDRRAEAVDVVESNPNAANASVAAPARRRRTDTTAIDSTITHPGSVKINVLGAFIVNEEPSSMTAGNASHHDTKDIRLPNHTAVVSHIAVDIGGSLAKLVYFSREPGSTEPGGRLNFITFETEKIDTCLDFMKQLKIKQQKLNGSRPGELCVMATGGGAYKYYDKIREALGVEVLREDEMECLIIGLDFFITEIPEEVFTYSENDPMHFAEARADIYPYLLVNIGSGVSMIKVSGPTQYQRIGGTSLGGGTLWGLLSLLTGSRTFDEMLGMAERGDNSAVDMLVGDIYGTDYSKIGLKSSTIASSFGKVFKMKREAEREAEDGGESSCREDGTSPADGRKSSRKFTPEDVSRSLLYAISNNIGQIAYLQSEKHNLSNIYFGGSFIRGHRQTMNTLSYAIKFWSEGVKKAYFLRHEGYLGAVGAFLKTRPRNWGRRNSLDEEGAVVGLLRKKAGGE